MSSAYMLFRDHLLLRDFGLSWGYSICDVCCYNRWHGNDVERFWVWRDNIHDCVLTKLDFPFILDGQLVNKKLSVHATEASGGIAGIAPTHSRPRH
jgi:hypothetical protein